MNLLLALLAFAGIMAFLSTLVSVFVEGLHKVFALRRAGLEEMLRSLHANVLCRFDALGGRETPGGVALTSKRESATFARAMTKNVAISAGGYFSWIRRIPVISGVFARRHQRLSTLQFVEQLAHSDIGPVLLQMPQTKRRQALVTAAYQFERYADSQTGYFQSRARVISVLASLVFVFAANVDAVHIFGRLYRDAALRGSVLAFLDEARIADLEQRYENRTETAATQPAQLAAQGNQARATIAQFQDLGVPIGYGAYPFCLGPAATNDLRCQNKQLKSIDASSVTNNLTGGNWVLWLFSVIGAGGLIGLGAPFWFEVFRRIARLVPQTRAVGDALDAGGPSGSSAGQPASLRQPNVVSPDALMLAFSAASGDAMEAGAPSHLSDGVAPRDPSLRIRGDGSVYLAG